MLSRLLVVIDAREASEVALSEALRLAAAQHCSLFFVGIAPPPTVSLLDISYLSILRANRWPWPSTTIVTRRIAAGGRRARQLGLQATHGMFDGPTSATELLRVAATEACDAIVVASDGRTALGRLLSGSVIPGLITHAPIPVIVCRAEERSTNRGARSVNPLPYDYVRQLDGVSL